ncbi:MAG: hypothetical protein K5750_04310 [Eubacterium sp.]|nr:hypothetical protein [Eubacterium sp.]
MVFGIINNFIVMILAVLALFFSKYPAVCLVLAGALMVVLTYSTFFVDDELSETDSDSEEGSAGGIRAHIFAERGSFTTAEVLKLLLAGGFSVLSGSFAGFFVFAVFDIFRPWFAAYIAMMLFFIANLLGLVGVGHSGREVAMMIVLGSIIYFSVMIVLILKGLVRRQQRRAALERQRIQNSNLNEMHEKRLNQELTKQNYLADKNARLVERENISRNIHNSVGHSITAAIMTLDAADMLYDVKPDEARKRMNDANERIRGSLESIRRAVRTLDDEAGTMPVSDLKAAMDGIIDDFVMDTERHVDRIYDVPDIQGAGTPDVENGCDDVNDVRKNGLQIPREHAEFLTGVLEELLTNGVKHGGATKFVVILTGDSAHIKLEVKDNGWSDFGESNSKARIENGFGVKKIVSYAERCGGKTGFVNDEGFRAFVELPVY